jgi:UDP-sulfoquinovose synthase
MGEYGTPNVDIPEGWMDMEHQGRKDRVLFPRQAGSLYHTTKIMDTDMLWFYVRVWGLRVTDLMQGPVYGIITDEMHNSHGRFVEDLLTNFHYDEIFGTVLNRFLVQAAIDHPLTVYGKGGQTRGYLNIRDTMKCVHLAATNPPERGELAIYNQITQTFSVNQLAGMVQRMAKDYYRKEVTIENIENPRVEKEEHYYNPTYTKFSDLGLEPIFLTYELLAEMFDLVLKYRAQVNKDIIFKGVQWK